MTVYGRAIHAASTWLMAGIMVSGQLHPSHSAELKQDSFSFAVIGDPHIWCPVEDREDAGFGRSWKFEAGIYAENLEYAVREVNHLKPQPDFVVFTGDVSHTYQKLEDAKHYSRTKDEEMTLFWSKVKNLKMPFYLVIGNHDVEGSARQSFGRLLKRAQGTSSTYYSFDYGRIHFVVLDTDDGSLFQKERQLRWLKSDLDASRDKATIVFLHHSLLPSMTGDRKQDEYFDSLALNHTDRGDILRLFDDYPNLKWVFHGHLHWDHFWRYRGKTVVSAAPLCVGPSQSGYRIVYVEGGEVVRTVFRELRGRPVQDPSPASLPELELPRDWLP